jgi:tetratricopeptide (TPR) repeat protein
MIAMSLMLATGFVGAEVVMAPQAAFAQKAPSVSPKVGGPLQAAQELLKKKQFKEAVVKAEEAAAVANKSPYETFLVNEILAIAYIQSGNYAKGTAAWEASLATGQMPADQAKERVKQLAGVYYQSKNYPKAIEYAQRFIKENGDNGDMQVLIGQSYYLQNNHKQAAEYLRAAVKATESAKRNPEKSWLELLMSAEYQLGNNDAVQSTMEKLITLYPDPKYWKDFVSLSERTLRGNTHTELDVARIKFHSGILTTDKEYTQMAEIALQEGLPGEAKAVLEKGNAAGVLGQPANKEREGRLLALAAKQAEADMKTLPQGVAEAQKQPKGDALVKFGEAYWTIGDNDKAIELINAGIAKGVDNKDDAQLRLGIAYISAGRRAEGLAAFKSISPGSNSEKVANLWKIHSSQKKA